MNVSQRPGRAAAVVGAVVAVSATTLMALVAGTASAAERGRCTDTVNVREQPDLGSRVVRLCRSGQDVQVGESRNGFVQLVDLGGWSAAEFVSVNGAPPAAPTSHKPSATSAPGAPSPSASPTPAPTTAPQAGSSGGSGGAGTGPSASPSPSAASSPSPAPAPASSPAPSPASSPEPMAPRSSPLGGLLP